jgi:hypothetical protein
MGTEPPRENRMPQLQLLALVANLQLELPTFKAHHHAPEFVPGEFPAIDDDNRHTPILGRVPLNPATDNLVIGDLHPEFALPNVLDRERAADLLDQSRQQCQQVTFGFADHLKLISVGLPISNLERIQGNAWPEQACPEMKVVGFPVAIREIDWREVNVLKLNQPIGFGDLGVEASGAKL